MQLTSLPDAQLVARCRSGDEDAWRELVSRFSRYVYAICCQAYRLRQEDAEEVFQEVFSRAYQHLGKLRDDEAIRPWLGQLTRRLCIDRLRAGSREEIVDLLTPYFKPEAPTGEELKDWMKRAIRAFGANIESDE